MVLFILKINVNLFQHRSECTPLMRASMFGSNDEIKSSETVLHLISRGADVYLKDKLDYNCLHYAALLSNEDTVNLLITLGIDANLKTKNGLKPFHLALYQNNVSLIKLLAPITDEIKCSLREKRINKLIKRKWKDTFDYWIDFFSKLLVVFCFLTAACWAYPQYALHYFPVTKDYLLIHIFVIFSSLFLWISFYKTILSNPGYLLQNIDEYYHILEEKLYSHPIKSNKTTVEAKLDDIKLCHICKTIQPLRSKHCRRCHRCTARFDHHCIYLGTCIGELNRISFFNLISNMLYSSLSFIFIILITAARENGQWTNYHLANLSFCLKIAIISSFLTLCTLRRAAINLTQNEDLRRYRYHYLWSRKGKFFNPFDKGSYLRNLIEHFKVRRFNSKHNRHLKTYP